MIKQKKGCKKRDDDDDEYGHLMDGIMDVAKLGIAGATVGTLVTSLSGFNLGR